MRSHVATRFRYNGATPGGFVTTIAIVLCCAACLWASRRLLGDWLTPLSVYALAWAGLVTAFLGGWVDYDAVAQRTWWAIAISATTFMLGAWTVALSARAARPGAPRPAPTPPRESDLTRALLLLLPLCLAGCLLQIRHLEATMGLHTLWEDPVAARELHSNVKYWGYLNILNVVSPMLVVIYAVFFKRIRWWMLCHLALALTSALLTTDRTRFFYMVMWALFAGIYATGGFRLTRTRTLVLAGTLTLLLGFFVLVGDYYERRYLERFPEYIHFQPPFESLVEPYIYLTGSIPALNALLEDQNPMYLGKFSFSPLVKLWTLADPEVETVPLQGKLYYVPMELNTYSYLQQFYLDWGWWGILLGPYVCGLLAMLTFQAYLRRPGFTQIYLTSLLTFCCAISIFVNMFTQEATWFFVLVGLGLGRWFERRAETRPRPRNIMAPNGDEV